MLRPAPRVLTWIVAGLVGIPAILVLVMTARQSSTLVGPRSPTGGIAPGSVPVFSDARWLRAWLESGDALALSHAVLVPKGSGVKVLETIPDRGRLLFALVRVLDGERVGTAGWVNGLWLEPRILQERR